MAKPKRHRPGSDWRFLAWADKNTRKIEMASMKGAIFDELVVDRWLHVEQMDRNTWWMQVGDNHVWVSVGHDGQASSVRVIEGTMEDQRVETKQVKAKRERAK